MEYTVGSLAGLISGKSPEKKQKVVAKEFKIPTLQEESPKKIKRKHRSESEQEVESPKKIKRKLKSESEQELESPKKIKRKLKSESDQCPVTQKSKKKKTKQSKSESTTEHPDHLDSDSEPSYPKAEILSQNDENAIKRVKKKKRQEKQESPQYNDRTVFVGNVPIHTEKSKLKKHFKKYGPIESLRIRGIPVKDPKTSKKVAAIKKDFHPDRNTVFAYIRFTDSESARKAEAENGALFQEHHLRVQSCEVKAKHDEDRAIFIGNLPFAAEEEDVWKLFQDCGEISHIRIIRDGRTGIGKGFGYVNFKESDSVQLAMELENVKLKDRELRISPCDIKRAKKKGGVKKPRHRNNKTSAGDNGQTENQTNTRFEGGKKGPKRFFFKKTGKEGEGENQVRNIPKTNFGGTKFDDIKKKKKFSKDLAQKKKLAKKLTSKSPSS